MSATKSKQIERDDYFLVRFEAARISGSAPLRMADWRALAQLEQRVTALEKKP